MYSLYLDFGRVAHVEGWVISGNVGISEFVVNVQDHSLPLIAIDHHHDVRHKLLLHSPFVHAYTPAPPSRVLVDDDKGSKRRHAVIKLPEFRNPHLDFLNFLF